MVAVVWVDRGTARAVRGRDSDLAAAGVQAGELEALAVQGAVGPAVAPACGILARQAAVAKELARVGPVWEVAPDPDPVGVEAEELAGLAREVGVERVAVVLEAAEE